jgi:hypothetical protein
VSDILLWDPTPDNIAAPEDKIRPTEADIVQVQRVDDYEYYLYMFPDRFEEFDSYDPLRNSVLRIIKDHVLNNDGPNAAMALRYDVEALADRGLSLMANFRIANIDLNDRVAYKVVAPRDISMGRGIASFFKSQI